MRVGLRGSCCALATPRVDAKHPGSSIDTNSWDIVPVDQQWERDRSGAETAGLSGRDIAGPDEPVAGGFTAQPEGPQLVVQTRP